METNALASETRKRRREFNGLQNTSTKNSQIASTTHSQRDSPVSFACENQEMVSVFENGISRIEETIYLIRFFFKIY